MNLKLPSYALYGTNKKRTLCIGVYIPIIATVKRLEDDATLTLPMQVKRIFPTLITPQK